MNEAALSCKRCANFPEVVPRQGEFMAICPQCGERTSSYSSPEKAVATWNELYSIQSRHPVRRPDPFPKIYSQPVPIPNDSKPVWNLVIEDMTARDHVGRKRYGTPLQINNGRDALQDAYEEALDLCVYLKQAIEERRLK